MNCTNLAKLIFLNNFVSNFCIDGTEFIYFKVFMSLVTNEEQNKRVSYRRNEIWNLGKFATSPEVWLQAA